MAVRGAGMEGEMSCKAKRELVWYMGLTFGLSWLCWLPMALSGKDPMTSGWVIPYAVGGFAPSLAGLVMMLRTCDEAERKAFWRRLVDVRRISWGWWGVILLAFPLMFGLSYGVAALVGLGVQMPEGLAAVLANPLTLVSLLGTGLVAGPLAEELGWRGYALDRLQRGRSALWASVLLFVAWWAWHLPLFFIEGSTQQALGFGSVDFWVYTVNLFSLTLVITRAYNRNGRSTLAAVLLHMAYNVGMTLAWPVPTLQVAVMALLTAAVWVWGERGGKAAHESTEGV